MRAVPGQLPASFVGIDFETCQPARSSPIQIGIVRVIDGVMGSAQSVPVMPPVGFRAFHRSASRVHGLGPSYIVGAAEWPEILARLVRFAAAPAGGLLPLVAHNASFERSVIAKTSTAAGVEPPELDYICTLQLSRTLRPNYPRHGLAFVTDRMGLPAFDHHDAAADAAASARLLLAFRGDQLSRAAQAWAGSGCASAPLGRLATVGDGDLLRTRACTSGAVVTRRPTFDAAT